jgi:hypothetical protein
MPVTKLKSVKKFEVVGVPGVRRPVIFEFDPQAKTLVAYEKRTRLKYRMGLEVIFRLLIYQGQSYTNGEKKTKI